MSKRVLIILICVGCVAALAAAGRWAFVNLRYQIVVATPINYSFTEFASKVMLDETAHPALQHGTRNHKTTPRTANRTGTRHPVQSK